MPLFLLGQCLALPLTTRGGGCPVGVEDGKHFRVIVEIMQSELPKIGIEGGTDQYRSALNLLSIHLLLDLLFE